MSAKTSKLFLISGKIASGKSTLARKLASENEALLISQDEWLSCLFTDEIHNLEDYVKYLARLSKVMGGHIAGILKAGASVVLDFPANTVQSRAWMKNIADSANRPCELHFIDVPDETCLARLKLRNLEGAHEYKVNEEEFRQFTNYFVAPTQAEGFKVLRHTPGNT